MSEPNENLEYDPDSDNNNDLIVGGGTSIIAKITNIIKLTQAVVFIVGSLLVITIMMSYLKKMWDGSQKVISTVGEMGEKTADFVVEISDVLANGVTGVVDETSTMLSEIGEDIAEGAESIIDNVEELGNTVADGVSEVAGDLGTLGSTAGNAAGDIVTSIRSMVPII